MKPLAALALALLWVASGSAAFAQTQPAPAPTNNPLSYDDPGMHFAPPAGWERIALAPPDPSANGEAPVALYVKNRGRSDQQLITVEIKPFDGSLEGLESSHESDLRSAVDSTFIDKRQRTTLQNGMPRPQLAAFGDNIDASSLRTAVYGQDEWTVGKQWAFYAGMRGEGITTKSTANNYDVDNRSMVWTPLLHALWKFDENSRDQIRASLTRSYRSPPLQSLVSLPGINSQYPCPDNALCGANVVNAPDQMGNPQLKPELARGLELAYEDYPTLGGVLSANFFYRHIENLIRTVTQLETVSWASVPRWVAQPQNIGDATTYGLELEAKFRLDQYWPGAPPIDLRNNLSLFHSHVEGIIGPHATLDNQPRGVGNIGFDYRMRSLPLSFGGNLNYTPAQTIQQTDIQIATNSKKRVYDAYALWTVNPMVAMRLSANNLAPLNYATGSVITTDQATVTTNAGGRSFTTWTIRLEIKT